MYTEQNVEELQSRMRALERRVASHAPDLSEAEIQQAVEALDRDALARHLALQDKRVALLNERMSAAEGTLDALRDADEALMGEIRGVAASLDDTGESVERLGERVDDLDRLLSVRMGRLRIPVDITGIVAAVGLFVAAYLLYAGRFDVLRDPRFSLVVGAAFALAVLGKFWVTNR